MRHPDICNRPPTRAPYGLIDSRARLPSGLAAFRFSAGRGAEASTNRSGRGSLDGEPEASAGSQTGPLGAPLGTEAPDDDVTLEPSAVRSWRVLRSTAPTDGTPRARCFRPLVGFAIRPLTPSVALHPPCPRGRNLTSVPSKAPGSLPCGLVKGSRFVGSRAPSIEECSLCLLSRSVWSPPPFSRLCRREPAFNTRSPLVARQ